jgi:hypothetical protein
MKKQSETKKLDKQPKTGKQTKGAKYIITIDHPKNDEVITHKVHYAIRTSTNTNGIVEISINNGEWQQCRCAAGHWWYDWHNIPEGKHIIIARLRDVEKNRTLKKSEPVCITVK